MSREKSKLVVIKLRRRNYFVEGLSKQIYFRGTLSQCMAFMDENFVRLNNLEYDMTEALYEAMLKIHNERTPEQKRALTEALAPFSGPAIAG